MHMKMALFWSNEAFNSYPPMFDCTSKLISASKNAIKWMGEMTRRDLVRVTWWREWMTPWWSPVMWSRFDQSNFGFQRPVMPFCVGPRFTIPLIRSLLFLNGPMRSHISHISRPARLGGWACYEWRTPVWGLSELMIITGPGDGWGLSFKTLDRISNKLLTNNLTVERCSSRVFCPAGLFHGWRVTGGR